MLIKEKLEEYSCRMFDLEHIIKFYVHCQINEVWSESRIELYSFGNMLQEYTEKSKKMYYEIEQELLYNYL